MILGIILIILATFIGIAFWILIAVAIYKLVTKKSVKKSLITSGILAFLWVVCIVCGAGVIISSKKDAVINAIPYISYESAKQNWSAKILKKTSDFKLSIDKIEVIRNEKEWLVSTDAQKKDYSEAMLSHEEKSEELLGIGTTTAYELTVVVENSGSAGISYKELRKSNLVYVQDENGVFIPAYIINHAEFDDVPWILTWFLPQYKKEQRVEYVPVGKSYLNVRVEIPNGHTISKFIFGNAVLDVNLSDFVKPSAEKSDN